MVTLVIVHVMKKIILLYTVTDFACAVQVQSYTAGYSFLAFLFFCRLACRFSCFLFSLTWFLAWRSLSAWSRASFIVLFVSSVLRLPLVLRVTKVFSVFSFIWCLVVCMRSDRWSVRTLTMFLSAVLIQSFHFCWNLGSSLSTTIGLVCMRSLAGSLSQATALFRASLWLCILSSLSVFSKKSSFSFFVSASTMLTS